jgi:hypothetical protein
VKRFKEFSKVEREERKIGTNYTKDARKRSKTSGSIYFHHIKNNCCESKRHSIQNASYYPTRDINARCCGISTESVCSACLAVPVEMCTISKTNRIAIYKAVKVHNSRVSDRQQQQLQKI